MGHAFEHCEWKDNIKIKRFGEKKVKVSGLLFFNRRLRSRAVPAGENAETRFHATGRTCMHD